MRPLELAVIYGVMGLIVAVTLRWRGRPGALVALVAWPLLLPGLWSAPPPVTPRPPLAGPADPASADARVEGVLADLALALDGGPPLPGAADCAGALAAARRGLQALAERAGALEGVVDRLPSPSGDQPASHPHARLRALRDDAAARLAAAIEAVSDLTARIHLARFTGAEPAHLGAALERLARAVDSAAEVGRLGASGSASAQQEQREEGHSAAAAAAARGARGAVG